MDTKSLSNVHIRLSLLLWLGVLCAMPVVVVGCNTKQPLITGEPVMYSVSPLSGRVTDRDIVSENQIEQGIIPHDGEIVTLVVNNVFIRHLAENVIGSPHVLVYAEVYDDAGDDPASAYTKVLYNEKDQPPGVNLGLVDRILYGPTPFKGFPIRVKFYIVELDKDEKAMASKIIDAAGGVIQAGQPEAAAAVGVAVQIAQAINAMNVDDFELRFDLTLFPVEQLGRATLEDPSLEGSGEIQRDGKPMTTVSSLRTGPYVILKRELPERFPEGELDTTPSFLDFDYAQPQFESTYAGGAVRTLESLRYEGGYLYRLVDKVYLNDAEVEGQEVILPKGSVEVPVYFKPGLRERFIDKTYVVLSVLNGLPAGVAADVQRASSQRDEELVRELLDNPENLSASERVGPYVDAIASSIKAVLEQRRLATEAAKRAGRDPEWRLSTDYVMYWTKQIRTLENIDAASRIYADNIAINAGILATLSGGLITNLPVLSPDSSTQMTALHNLERADFERVSSDAEIALEQLDTNKIAGQLNAFRQQMSSAGEQAKVASLVASLSGGRIGAAQLQQVSDMLTMFRKGLGKDDAVTNEQVDKTLTQIRGYLLPCLARKGQFKLVSAALEKIEATI